METHTQPSAAVIQLSVLDAEKKYVLSVLTKRTYRLQADGRCLPSEEQLPLVTLPVNDPENAAVLLQDTDLYPIKLATDVVVKGHAYGAGQTQCEAVVQIGKTSKTILVVGDRKATLSTAGQIVLSSPRPFDKMPLRYDRAYGGHDAVAQDRYGDPNAFVHSFIPSPGKHARSAAYTYPRNPAGAGYLIEATPKAVEQLRLPNLEDPQDRLTGERLAVGRTGRWPLMPMPQAFDWVDHGWFPRVAWVGLVPDYEIPLVGPVPEIQRGLTPEDVLRHAPAAEKISFRFASGASLGLQLPYLKGNEECLLGNLHPKQQRLVIRLPGERPRIWTDGRRGKLNETQPVLHSVIIEPDENRLSVVWRGSAAAMRPYSAEELMTMPLKVEWDVPVPAGARIVIPAALGQVVSGKPDLSTATVDSATDTAISSGVATSVTTSASTSGGLPKGPPSAPATAPATLTLPLAVVQSMQRLMEASQGGQRGGILVRGTEGLMLCNDTVPGQAQSFRPEVKTDAGDVVGVFHTHPDAAGGLSFSGGDVAAFLGGGLLVEVVQSGPDQFLLLRTQQTPKTVSEQDVLKSADATMRPLLAAGKTLAEVTQASVASLAAEHRLAFYQGKDGQLVRIRPA